MSSDKEKKKEDVVQDKKISLYKSYDIASE